MTASVLRKRLLGPALFCALAFACLGTACSDDETTDPVDAGSDVVEDTTGDAGTDVVEEVTPDVVEEVTPDVVEEVTPDVVEDVEADTPADVSDTTEDVTDTTEDTDVEIVCEGGCGDCEMCELVDDTPTCVSTCMDCEACQDVDGDMACVDTCGDELVCARDLCVRAGDHAALTELAGPFPTGPDVTAACVDCHEAEANQFLDSPHWRWAGPTPGLVGHEEDTDIGKRNLVNNFCVAVQSNEARCAQCHAGYNLRDDTFDFDSTANMDCLICHADPASGYAKGPRDAGNPAEGVDLVLAAQSVGATSTANCGSCHFSAGGGDNVKLGDMGSALGHATTDIDVHLGGDMDCSSCHAGDDHTIIGSGVHLPVSQGALDCTDCHEGSVHDTAMLDEHALDIACQTCHVPTFSRTQATKMDWDWSTSGNRTIGSDGVRTTTIGDGVVVRDYDYMKGDFVWEIDVTPSYGWYDGRVTRLTAGDTWEEGQGAEENPVLIAGPVASYDDADARIHPFKVMTGQQPGHPDNRYLIVPHLFGPGSFWAGIPSADDFTPEALRTLWTNALSAGALAAGQIAEGESFGEDDWEWVFTSMYIGINHEVAPASQALGASGCGTCHSESGVFDWEALGYSCDPAGSPATCGSRHYTD